MKPKYQQFIFEDYTFDTTTQVLSLQYSFDGTVPFTETFHFDFPFAAHDPIALDRAFQVLFFMAGVSYYKAYVAPEIVVKKGQLDGPMVTFFAKTYQRGLGEFFYVNQLDPRTLIHFPITSEQDIPPTSTQTGTGILIGLGGGKDSLVSVELLRRSNANIATWNLNHRPQLTPLVERIGLPHYFVEREWDPSLIKHNAKGALNGHVPISAILAACGTIVAILSGRQDVTVSNELSANEPTLHVDGVAINHQYSKSAEFEEDFQQLLAHVFTDGPRYYSFLRPLSELHIADLFCRTNSLTHYEGVFSSCNRAYVHTSDHIFWDGTCPKCAFFFLAMAPFARLEQLTSIFSGKNLLHTSELEPTYRQLLGIAGDKPLECVGEIKESRTAMRLVQGKDSDLAAKYHFDIPDDYDYRALGDHHMPAEIFMLFRSGLASLHDEQPE
jgi:hypothetical protein